MKKMDNKWEEYSDEEWEFLASCLSDENGTAQHDESDNKTDSETARIWKSIGKMGGIDNSETNTDKAWDALYGRLKANDLLPSESIARQAIRRNIMFFARIAALFTIVAGLGWGAFHFLGNGSRDRMITASTSGAEKNVAVTLPDGSTVILNHDTKISYPESFKDGNRKITLSGEAFFDVVRDPSNPFIIDAGKASVKVLGTSFNVNTSNYREEVEVYVSSGTVMLAANNGSDSLTLEAGFMGRTINNSAEKQPITNPNYLAWNSGKLIYEGTRLETVFNDLKSVYGIEISVTDTTIMGETITTVFEDLTEEEFIKNISISFGLKWSKEGRVYVLSR